MDQSVSDSRQLKKKSSLRSHGSLSTSPFQISALYPGKLGRLHPLMSLFPFSEQVLVEHTVVARVDGTLWDKKRPLEGNCDFLDFLDFSNDEAKAVYWHSSAHVLGEAAEKRFGCHLCIGLRTNDGFFYELGMPKEHYSVTNDDLKGLSTSMDSIVKGEQPFERLVVSKEDLLTLFQSNRFKQEIIQSKIPDGTPSTIYGCGPLIDLCRGPHVSNTSRIKFFSLLKTSASYFLGILRILLCECMGYRSRTRNCSRSTSSTSKKLRSVTTDELIKIKSSSCSTNYHLDPPFSFLMV